MHQSRSIGSNRSGKDIGAIVDLVGKGGHIRTVPMPLWVKAAIGRWMSSAMVTSGRVSGPSAVTARHGAQGFLRT